MAPNPLTLKQRLAALSTSLPGVRSDTPPQSPIGKRRSFFNSAVGKRPAEFDTGGQVSEDRVQDVMNKVIFQAGVDYESVFDFQNPYDIE